MNNARLLAGYFMTVDMGGITFSDLSFSVALACTVVFISLVTPNTYAQIQIGPSDITRMEGERNEFIPCPFDGINTPFWRINDTFYHFSILPCPFIASTSPVGLVISVVDRTISGTSFQCFAAGTGQDPSVQASTIGVLTVLPDPLYGENGEDMNTTLSVQLIAQQVWFSEHKAFLSWSRFDKDTVVENDSSLRYILYSSNCDVSNNASVLENTTNTNACLSLGDPDGEFFNISAVDETGYQRSTINELFRISPGVVTKSIEQMIGSTCPVCVDVPQPNTAPSFNIPSTASDKQDILCTVVRTTGEGKCLNLNATCDGFNETSFASSLTICSSTSSSTDYRMCFSSITEKMNNTKIHFFYSSSPFCSITSRRVTSRLYIDSYEIIAQDSSGVIDMTFNASTGEICLTSLPRGCFSTTTYNFTVTDITGYAVSTAADIRNGVCTPINVPQPSHSVCAPYDIAVDAYNPLVIYRTVYKTVGQGQATSFCDCAQQRAQVNLHESAPGLGQIEISCYSSATSNNNYGIKFSIVAMDRATNTTVSTSELVSCTPNINTRLEIANLSCSRVYSVCAEFSFPNESRTRCQLSNTTTINSGVCPTSPDVPTGGPSPNTLAIVLPVIIVTVVLALIVIAIITVAIIALKRHGTGTYSPQQAEMRRGPRVNLKDSGNPEEHRDSDMTERHLSL